MGLRELAEGLFSNWVIDKLLKRVTNTSLFINKCVEHLES